MKPTRALLSAAVLLAALGLAASPASAPRRTHRPFRSTVEPTLALRIDLSLDGLERGRASSSGRLRVDLSAVDDVTDVDLVLRSPDGLTFDGAGTAPPRIAALRRGEARTLALPFSARRERDLEIRVEATFRTAAGAAQTLAQGVTLTVSEKAPPGHRHLGAYECQAVPLSELRR